MRARARDRIRKGYVVEKLWPVGTPSRTHTQYLVNTPAKGEILVPFSIEIIISIMVQLIALFAGRTEKWQTAEAYTWKHCNHTCSIHAGLEGMNEL